MSIRATKAVSLHSIMDWNRGNNPSLDDLIKQFDDVWLVSIVGFGDPQVQFFPHRIPPSKVLRLKFDDIVPEWYKEIGVDVNPKCLFSKKQANLVVDFLDRADRDETKRTLLLAHCWAGVSRSGAVVTFAANNYNLDSEEFLEMNTGIIPNVFVFRLLNEAVNIKRSRAGGSPDVSI